MPRPNFGPHLARNSQGVYEIRWTDAGRSRRKSAGTRDLAIAQAVLAEFLRLPSPAVASRPTFAALLDLYWREHASQRPTRGVVLSLIANLKAHFADLTPADLTPDDLRQYAARRQSGEIGRSPAAAATVIRELRVLSAAQRRAVKSRLVSAGDLIPISAPVEAPQPRDVWLSDAEAAALVAAAQQRPAPDGATSATARFIVLALHSAARAAALLDLEWRQVDLRRRVIDLNPPGRRQTPKKRPRVPIDDALLMHLYRWRAEDAVAGRAAEGHVVSGARRLVRVREGFIAAVAASGIGRRVTPHTLRHTWATRAAQEGVSLWEIAGVLGDSLAMVTTTYAHHCPDHLRRAVEWRATAGVTPKSGASMADSGRQRQDQAA